MENDFPLVSVCIPVYNGELFLKEALESVLNQTYRNLEIVISDDDSSDRSLQIAFECSTMFNVPFKILKNKHSGIGANWNNCIRNSKGKFIKFLFQDDILMPECIGEMIELVKSFDEMPGLIFCEREIIGNGNEAQYQPINKNKNLRQIQDGITILKDPRLFNQPRNKIGEPSSVLINTSVFQKVGYFNEKLKQSLDYEFWYRICQYYKIGFIDKKLTKFRIHENQTTIVNSKKIVIDRYLLPFLLLKNHFKVLPIKSKSILIYKTLTGFIAYYIFKI